MMGVFVQTNESSQRGRSQPIGYVIQENGCWDWTGGTDRKGYGMWPVDGHAKSAHRMMYVRVKGAIPKGLTLDHLCRNRLCINPDHLEPVTNKENVLRGAGHTAQNAKKTHCPRGHEFTEANTIREGPEKRHRKCRTCDRAYRRSRYSSTRQEVRMSALTDRLLAEARKEFNLLAVAHDDLIAAPTTTANLTDAVGERERDVVSALLRALAGETLDAATEAACIVVCPDSCGAEWVAHIKGTGKAEPFRSQIQMAVEAAAPVIRAPLLVQVAELEAQLAAARDAMEKYKAWWDAVNACAAGVSGSVVPMETEAEARANLFAALTGATQK